MKAFLFFKNRDFDLHQSLPLNEKDLVQDLELDTLFKAMSLGDDYLFDISKKVVLSGLNNLEEIKYRQDILRDCIKNPEIVREIYQIPLESIENKRKGWMSIFSSSPDGVLYSSLRMMQMFVGLLRKLKKIADDQSEKFESEGFIAFFSMIKNELSDEYFALLELHLKQLKFQGGVLISARLGVGNEGKDFILRSPNSIKGHWLQRFFIKKPTEYSFVINGRDEAGIRSLSDIKDKGLNLVANALAQSVEHIDSFFNLLRLELAFYIGCLNLHNQMIQIGNPVTFPFPKNANERTHLFRGLYDISLALSMNKKVVGNEINALHKNFVFITGANQGGKTTFLRSIGLAQLMMQSGMFVPAEKFQANICTGLFTHFKRKEDASMKSGKLDEELGRMSDLVDLLSTDSLMLFNESFTATNEREGSEIASQITSALIEKQIKVFYVTHMYAFAQAFYQKKLRDGLFLQAERNAGGRRTFKIIKGKPSQTSFGEDVFREVFGVA